MSPEQSTSQQKQREFFSLLPLTIEIAGMPPSEVGKLFTESQMEARVTGLRTAYKLARQLVMEIGSS